MGLWQAQMGKHPIRKLGGHGIEASGPVVKGRNQREDGSSGVGGTVHVADVDFVERSLANAEHQRASFLEGDIGGTVDKVGREAVGNAGERTHAARNHDHRVDGIGTTGHVGAMSALAWSWIFREDLPSNWW